MKKFHYLSFGISFALAVAFSSLETKAEVVTFYFSGNVSSVYNPFGLVSSSLISVGNPVQASLSFDTATPDWPLYVNDPTRGSFVGPGSLKVKINGLDFERTTTVQVDILHGANGGQELFQAMVLGDPTIWPSQLPTFTYPEIYMAFWETMPPFDLLTNAELPVAMDFSRADMVLAFVRAGTSGANMYEIQFNLHQVPEPGSASFFVTALLCFMIGKRFRDQGRQ